MHLNNCSQAVKNAIYQTEVNEYHLFYLLRYITLYRIIAAPRKFKKYTITTHYKGSPAHFIILCTQVQSVLSGLK